MHCGSPRVYKSISTLFNDYVIDFPELMKKIGIFFFEKWKFGLEIVFRKCFGYTRNFFGSFNIYNVGKNQTSNVIREIFPFLTCAVKIKQISSLFFSLV